MKTIVVKTQAELDALPEKFTEYTAIEIRSEPGTWLKVTKARESSRVEAWGSSQVEAWGSSRVEARESSRVVARESSQVVARESSRVVARESSQVVARESSQVVARESSRVVARESSRVEAWGSSQVEAWDTTSVHLHGDSTVSAFFFCVVFVKSFRARITHLADKTTAKFCDGILPKGMIIKKDKTAHVETTPKELSYETLLKRGYLMADGITQKVISHRKLKTIEVFEVEGRFGEKNFVVKKGNIFSHGKTLTEAKDSLIYKISSRDTSEFKKWKKDTVVTQAKMIQAYRAITGACEFGTKNFCEGKTIPKKLTVLEAIKLTAGQYGSEQFKGFFAL